MNWDCLYKECIRKWAMTLFGFRWVTGLLRFTTKHTNAEDDVPGSCAAAVALQSICHVCCSGNAGRVIWSFLPSLVAFRLVGRNSFSRLGILSSVDGVNLQCLLQPFSFTDMLCQDNHHWTPFVLVGCFFWGVCGIFHVLKGLESVRKLHCQLRLVQSCAVWLKKGYISEKNPLL